MSSDLIYLAQDGNWGSAKGLLVFNESDLPDDLRDLLNEDPESAYDAIHEFIAKEEE